MNYIICPLFDANDMNYTSEWITYASTGSFSHLAIQYLQQDISLQPFYKYTPDASGIDAALQAHQVFNTQREVLVNVLKQQYAAVATTDKVSRNIESLLSANTFTVTTAHQPNIFTGYLYFVYKIMHAIKLADELNEKYPGKHFVPVYYMGSEDNDLEELNHLFLNADRLTWNTSQTGPVGRMHTKGLDTLIDQVNGRLSIFPHGPELIAALKQAYLKSNSVQEATLQFVNFLFQSYGLVILIPDHTAFKKLMIPVFEDDIFNNTPAQIVKQTAARLAEKYHAQVNPRNINLFYMKDGLRERIIAEGDGFIVNNTNIRFTTGELRNTLHNNPELFSPNVVLRGIMQETLLPNIVFIGGGSEIAYWLELKDMFDHYAVPYPVLLLRNSYTIVSREMKQLMDKLELSVEDLFKSETTLQSELVLRNSKKQLSLQPESSQLQILYQQLETIAGAVDPTLGNHVKALYAKASKAVDLLEKKMMRAEKKSFDVQNNQLGKLKNGLFPNNNLQERVESMLPFYAAMGKDFIQLLYQYSPTLQQNFGVLIEN